jgi:palmitoyltransferase ZDHHC9/14/18
MKRISPFSSKNVQECRCGTASCRGVLGPRSKDAPKTKAAATALVAGAKRKIQDVFGSKGSRAKAAGPDKRRKVATIARSALAKAKKSVTESQISRDARAEKGAAEMEARGASRAERAIRRSSSTITLASKCSKVLRKGSPASLKTVASKRVSAKQTTASTARPGALRRPSTRLSNFTSAVKRHSSTIKSASRKPILLASQVFGKQLCHSSHFRWICHQALLPLWLPTMTTISMALFASSPHSPHARRNVLQRQAASAARLLV